MCWRYSSVSVVFDYSPILSSLILYSGTKQRLTRSWEPRTKGGFSKHVTSNTRSLRNLLRWEIDNIFLLQKTMFLWISCHEQSYNQLALRSVLSSVVHKYNHRQRNFLSKTVCKMKFWFFFANFFDIYIPINNLLWQTVVDARYLEEKAYKKFYLISLILFYFSISIILMENGPKSGFTMM